MRLMLACVLGALLVAPAAAADIRVGAADDHPKASPEIAGEFYEAMKDVGLTENRITLLWDSAHPMTIESQDNLAAAIQDAQADGVRITLDIYPSRAKALTESRVAPARFANFVALVARTFPTVKDFIVGNEPNKSRFWQPQFNANHTRAACAAYEPVLAASYDALKSVDRSITVIGVGLGPRGTDNPVARGNLSISPARCLADMGRVYRRSRRTKPIMDALSYHAYPNASTDKLETGYAWPNAGIPDLARVKQAVWDAFHRTGQPTFEEAGMPYGPARTLKLRLNEVGWQVAIPPASRGAYYGKESVVTTDEGTQAAIYGNLIPLLACDPAVESVLFFNLVDEANLDRWQSGLMRADWTRRPSYGIVKGAIVAGQTRCAGRRVAWRHEYRPVGVHLRRPLPRQAPGEGGADSAGADLALAADRAHAGRGPEVARQARRRLGQGDPVSAEAAEARVLRLRGEGGGGAEPRAQGDVRESPVRGRKPETLT
ncbi:MAG: hypothetical protein E6G31_11660 [Actinobacteria bacterium]|nr:MAG: hypothetical protein E6G31_11660 [Actinomycetota bacterium]